MTETVHVEQWPHEATKVDAGSVAFAPVEATIARVINGPGYVFEGDDTASGRTSEKTGEEYIGVVWWMQGEWDEGLGGRTAPIDLGFKKGNRVIVNLTTRRSDQKTFYNCLNIKAASGSQPPQSAPAAHAGAPGQGSTEWVSEREKQLWIRRAVAFKGQTEVVVALIALVKDETTLQTDELIKWSEMRDAIWAGEQPEADDFQPEDSPLVRNAQAMGAEVDDWGPRPPPPPEEETA